MPGLFCPYVAIAVIYFFLLRQTRYSGLFDKRRRHKNGIDTGAVVNLIFVGLWEAIYIIDKYKESLADIELIEHMGTQPGIRESEEPGESPFSFQLF
jgi:hypothetical protein